MQLRIRNNWKYKGEDRWEWSAFIEDDGTDALKEVEYVEYILHPTFRDPIRKIKDRASKFKLETEGWGTFKLKAFVYTKDGDKRKLEHAIVLEYEPVKGTTK